MTPQPYGRLEFAADFNVPRETLEKLDTYVSLLTRWNKSINLVSSTSLPEVWHRHVADSVQLLRLNSLTNGRWLDLGSGAGFPGLAVAILAQDSTPNLEIRLLETDTRKCAFLATVVGECHLSCQIVNDRAEEAPPQHAHVVSARALAPLRNLIPLAERHLAPGGIGLFHKGETARTEIAEAQALRSFQFRLHPSRTNHRASVVEVEGLSRDIEPL